MEKYIFTYVTKDFDIGGIRFESSYRGNTGVAVENATQFDTITDALSRLQSMYIQGGVFADTLGLSLAKITIPKHTIKIIHL